MNDAAVSWRSRFWLNTLSSYVHVVTRMAVGVLLFRLLYQHLSDAEFGFWALLWSLISFGVLLEFGFGVTAQKAVAEKTVDGDRDGLSRLLATIFWGYVGLAAVIVALCLAAEGPLLAAISAPADRIEEFSRTYRYFVAGVAVLFPLGLFPEILRGLHRLHVVSWVQALGAIAMLVAAWAAIGAGWGFSRLMLAIVVVQVVPNVVALVLVRRLLPSLSLSPRMIDPRALAPQLRFSFATYLISCSTILITRCDQLVVSVAIDVAALAVYQVGFKVAEMLNLFGRQLQSALSPAASQMRAQRDGEGLRALVIDSARITFAVVTPCYVLVAFYLEPVARVLTGERTADPRSVAVGQVLLLAVYLALISAACAKRVLMMCGMERRLMWLALGHAATNLALSIVLAQAWGLLGVAVATLVSTIAFDLVLVLPLALRFVRLPLIRYAGHHLRGTLPALIVFALVLAVLAFAFPHGPGDGLLGVAWRGLLALLPVALLNRRAFRAIVSGERD